MRTPSVGSDRRSYRRSSDSIAGDYDVETSTGGGVGSMLPAFLRDLSVPNHRNLYEVMLEMDEDSIVVRSVTPTAASASGRSSDHSRSSSPTIRRKFAWWLRLPPSPSPSVQEDPAMMAREARKRQARLERMRSGAQRALKGLRFISNSTVCGGGESDGLWTTVESRFRSLAKDGLLSRDDFGDCIGMEDSKEFATGVFDALCRRRRQKLERINRDELYDFWLQISNQSFDARLQIFFDMVDTNADGRITRKEVQELITLSASANKLAKLEEQVEEYASLIMEELDPENLGYIELWQLEALLLSRDIYMNYSRPLATPVGWQSQNNSGGGGGGFPRKKRNLVRRAAYYLHENWRKGWVVALWVTVMAALFAWKFVQYRRSDAFRVMGYCLTTAKGAAETLKLNMALVLLPVCRNTLTWLRSTRAGLFVPFDDNINFHKMIAVGIVAGVALHAGNHLACDFPRLLRAPPEKFRLVANDFGGVTPTYGGLLTGIEGLTGIAMVVLMAVSFTLATKRFRKSLVRLPSPLNRLTGFNAFWYSHHLFVVVYALLLVHGYFMFLVHNWYEKTTWMYLCFPLLVYMGERILRTFRSEAYSARILKVAVLPGSVLSLVMTKPHGFRYKSGQYIFIKCPAVSPFEWHPFSITSAPGDDHLSVHIRTVGDWTEELRRVFTEAGNSSSNIGRAKFDNLGRINQKSLPRLLVDGPYGAAAQDYTNYDVLLLVGLGIGATPFISILRDLLNNRTKADEQNDSTTDMSKSDDSFNSFSFGSTTSSSKKRPQRTTSAHFYWVTREPGSFEWFKGVMDEVAKMDQKGIIEMHNYLTSVYEEGDARSTLLLMVQALNHAKNGVDIVSGTRVRTHFARPNWNDVFSGIASKHPQATIGVFYCGMPVLAKELKRLSHEFSQRTTTRFHFHKEHF